MKENLASIVEHASQSSEIARDIISACLEAKGQDVKALDVSQIFGESDYFVMVSGRSDRQVQGIAHKVLEALDRSGISPVSMEGFEKGQWVLIDTGEVILHIFYEPMRAHYDLESLWFKARKVDLRQEMRLELPAAEGQVRDRRAA